MPTKQRSTQKIETELEDKITNELLEVLTRPDSTITGEDLIHYRNATKAICRHLDATTVAVGLMKIVFIFASLLMLIPVVRADEVVVVHHPDSHVVVAAPYHHHYYRHHHHDVVVVHHD
jgi:hypothetical protein